MVGYDDFAETFGASRQDMHWPEIEILLDDFVESFKTEDIWKIADIGCGNGRLLRHILEVPKYLELFQTHHTHYFGADLSEKLLQQAKDDPILTQAVEVIEWKQMDMCDTGKIFSSPLFQAFFFIASFHHLENSLDRLSVLQDAKKILLPGGKIYMTNWNLLSPENERYIASKTLEYPDESADFSIKIGEYQRFYHAFSLVEYQKLAEEA